MSSFPPNQDASADPEAEAADWLIAKDRGFTMAEERAFEQWLHASHRHAAAWRRTIAAWNALDRMPELRAEELHAHPAVFPARRMLWCAGSWCRLHWRLAAAGAGVLAACLAMVVLEPPDAAVTVPIENPPAGALVRLEPRRAVLPDGTHVMLNGDSEISEQFTTGERRVQLVRGEAHFEVTPNSSRPFVVVSHEVAVRAVGTAFNVRLAPGALEVWVTEGKVQVAGLPEGAALPGGSAPARALVPLLQAGERAIVPLAGADTTTIDVSRVSAPEMQRSLDWRTLRLRFHDLPLPMVAEEFNRHNATRLVVEPSARHVLVAGTFSADNVDVFVEFLQSAFGVSTERHPDGTVNIR